MELFLEMLITLYKRKIFTPPPHHEQKKPKTQFSSALYVMRCFLRSSERSRAQAHRHAHTLSRHSLTHRCDIRTLLRSWLWFVTVGGPGFVAAWAF